MSSNRQRTTGSRSYMGATFISCRPTRAPRPPWTQASAGSLAVYAARSRRSATSYRVASRAWRGALQFFRSLRSATWGPLDYQRIAHSFHTLMIEAIPVLGPEQRNEARRLITLIDVLYDNGVG